MIKIILNCFKDILNYIHQMVFVTVLENYELWFSFEINTLYNSEVIQLSPFR